MKWQTSFIRSYEVLKMIENKGLAGVHGFWGFARRVVETQNFASLHVQYFTSSNNSASEIFRINNPLF